jgi:hypothetical protein
VRPSSDVVSIALPDPSKIESLRERGNLMSGAYVCPMCAPGCNRGTSALYLARACDRRPRNSQASEPAAARYPRGTRRPLSQRDHCLGDHADRRIGDRSGSFLEDEQPCPGDLARDCLAVGNGEEQVPAAVDDERGNLDLG